MRVNTTFQDEKETKDRKKIRKEDGKKTPHTRNQKKNPRVRKDQLV